MNFIFCHIFIIFGFFIQQCVLTKDYVILNRNTTTCDSVFLQLKAQSHTFLVEPDSDHTNYELIDCLTSIKISNQSVIIFSGEELELTTESKLKEFIYGEPNVIVITKTVSEKLLLHPVLRILFQSQWSNVHVITTDPNYTCDNGHIKDEVYASVKNFLYRLWREHEIVRAVVEFPLTCHQKFIVYDELKPTREYDRPISSVHANDLLESWHKYSHSLTRGYPLRANIFHRFPTSVTRCDKIYNFIRFNINITNGHCGLDALMMHDVVSHFGFNVTFVNTMNISSYGYARSGRITGSLGGIIRKEIDISFNSRFLVSYMSSGYDFLRYAWYDSLCALMKEPDAVPLWHFPFNIYSLWHWMITILVFATIGMLMFVLAKLTSKKSGRKTLKIYTYVMNTVWSGLFGYFLNKNIQKSLLAASCLLFSVVITAKYQGHVNYMFTTLVRFKKLSTLADLRDNNIGIYTSPSVADILGKSDDSSNNPKSELLRHLDYYPRNMSSSEFVLKHPNRATIERRSDIMLKTMLNFTDECGRPLLYVVDECFHNYYLSWIVRSGFLFTKDINTFMTRLVESGLPVVYYEWTRYMFCLEDITSNPGSEPRAAIKITMEEQRVAFALLFAGYILSTIVFIKEKWLSGKFK